MSQDRTIEAVYENGVFRPSSPMPIASPQNVTLIVQMKENKAKSVWPDDAAEIYKEIAEEDRRIAQAMQNEVVGTWPAHEE